MKHPFLAAYTSVALAGCGFLAGFILDEFWVAAGAAVLLSLVWVLAVRFHKAWLLHIALVLSVICAAAGGLNGTGKAWMVAGMLLYLAAWDLAFFEVQLDSNIKEEARRIYRQKHLRLLSIVLAVGALASAAAISITLNISFGWIFLLAIAAAISLSRFILHWRKRIQK